jgi:hypothetical protein
VTVPAVCSITDPFIYEDKDTRFVTGRELGFMLMILFSAMATSMAMPYVTDTVNRWHPNNAGLKVKKQCLPSRLGHRCLPRPHCAFLS